jgi:DNA invertase Pin-like site-specific DNA recombinase
VVARMDRLARKLTVQEAILAQVWKYRGHVFAADVGEIRQDDPSDPMLTAFRQVLGIFAELDRAMTVKRMTDGKNAKRAQGGYVGGSVPYGFKRGPDDQLVPVPDEQYAIRHIQQLRARGFSLRHIAQDLEGLGIRNRSGSSFDPKSISRVLTRPE